MLKPLTMSLGLGLALGMTSLGVAGHKAFPSAQGVAPSPQGVVASAQDVGCGDVCGPVAKKHCSLFDKFKPKPKCYEYEWVLKKKKVHGGLFGGCHKGGDVGGGCEVLPSAQYPSAQGGPWAAPQGGYVGGEYGSGQILGTGQATYGAGQLAPAGQMTAPAIAPGGGAPATGGDPAAEPPPLPREAGDDNTSASNNGGLLLLPTAGN